MIVVTGATGHLGQLVVEALETTVGAANIIAAVRTPAKAGALAERGVQVRAFDYSRPETHAAALQGATKLLLISGNELGQRVAQHKSVIESAKAAGVQFVAYTSILHCDTSPLSLAEEHLATERDLQASGLKWSLLRNGWYFENQTAGIAPALQQGAMIGASGNGQFSAAARADYALAAANVLSSNGHDNTTYELAGDTAYTRTELAAEVSKQTGKTIPYRDLPEAEYAKILSSFLPGDISGHIADAEAHAASGALQDATHTLSRLIGRPTTTLAEAVKSALETPGDAH